jgi:hypothetical protein
LATLQEAIEEAYASANLDIIPLHALEINHAAFDVPLRVMRWPLTGPEATKFQCKHEIEAPIQPGQMVEYIGFPFSLSLPESSMDTEGSFKLKISMFNNFDEYLILAASYPGIITCTYRQYIKDREFEGPAAAWYDIEISSPRREGGEITADGIILGWMRKPFGGLYLPIDYPALIKGR